MATPRAVVFPYDCHVHGLLSNQFSFISRTRSPIDMPDSNEDESSNSKADSKEDDESTGSKDEGSSNGLEMHDAPDTITVKNAGSPAVCGVYQKDCCWGGAYKYTMIGEYDGRVVQFSIILHTYDDGTREWNISIVPSDQKPGTNSGIDFYFATFNQHCRYLPPKDGWETFASEEKFDQGVDPSPILVFPGDEKDQLPALECKQDKTTMTRSKTRATKKAQGVEETSTTVKFNVGGKLYEVSRSLLDRFPSTKLAEKASEWSLPSPPIFIDRDGDRFAYCLDYMRDNGTVYLPETVSKTAILRDLEFLGFEDIHGDDFVIDEKSNQNCLARSDQVTLGTKRRIANLEKKVEASELSIRILERDLKRRKVEVKMEKLALKCRATCVESTKDRFSVGYSGYEGLSKVHKDQYFIECCDRLALCVDGNGSSGNLVYLTRKTNTED